MRFKPGGKGPRRTILTPTTPTTYDKLPDLHELTTEEFLQYPVAARQKMLRDAMEEIDKANEG